MGEVVGTSEAAKLVLEDTLGYPRGWLLMVVEPLGRVRVQDVRVVAGLVRLVRLGSHWHAGWYRGSVQPHRQQTSWINGIGVPCASETIYQICIGSGMILGQNPISFAIEPVPGPRLVI